MAAKTKSTAPNRISFAKIREPQEVPNLLALQIESFDWLLGNDAWRARLGKKWSDFKLPELLEKFFIG